VDEPARAPGTDGAQYEFDADTAVREVAPGTWQGEITDRWDIGDIPNGGYVLAIAIAGMRGAIGRGPGAHPSAQVSHLGTGDHPGASVAPPEDHVLTVTGHYLAPCRHGPVTIGVEVVKQGRTVSTLIARLVQDDRTRLMALATFGDLTAQQGPTLVTASPPGLPDRQRCPSRISEEPTAFSVPPRITERVELLLSPATAAALADRGRADGGRADGGRALNTPPARMEGWARLADGRPLDTRCLPLLCDALPPAVLTSHQTGWVPTLELTVHIRAVPTGEWLRATATTRVLVDGLLEEDCELWDDAGNLVAMSRQLAKVLPPA